MAANEAQTSSCPNCGATSAPGAQFCRACGRRLVVVCGHCSQQLAATARFCGKCGTPVSVASPHAAAPEPRNQPRPARRRPLPRRVALPGLALILLVLGGFAWALFLRGGGSPAPENSSPAGEVLESKATVTEKPAEGAVDSLNGLPLRGRVRLDHPSGASADIPGGASLYGETMDLRSVELPDDPWWDHGGKGWQFVSYVGVPISGAATIDLPAEPASASVIVRTSAGFWTELPAEKVALKDGRAGLRVTVTNVPAPWTFALATPKAGAPALTAEEEDDLRLETLYWTDRAAWEAETKAWLASNPFVRSIDDGLYASQQPPSDPAKQYDKIRAQMRFTLKVFGAARLGLDSPVSLFGGESNPLHEELSPQELWMAGVQRLAAVEQNWLSFRATLDLTNAEPNFQVAIYFVDQWIETAMHDYTPWGLGFVKTLIDGGELQDFDIRVLKPYGELQWTEIVLKPGQAPAAIEALALQQLQGGEEPIGAGLKVQRVLRLYGVRSMERLALVDWLKQNVDWLVRWLPVALAGAGLVPGAVGLSFAFALTDQILDWVNNWYTANNEHPYAYMAMEGVSAGGLGGTSFILDMAEERVLMQEAGRGMLPAHGLTIAQFAYSIGMFTAIRGTDYYLFKSIRTAAEGTRGYCADGKCDSISGGIPPVMLHYRGAGLQTRPEELYPVEVDRLMSFRLQFSGADYHQGWLSGTKGPSGAIAQLPFEAYGQSNWPVVVTRTQPQYQAIRLGIPKSAIPPEVWGDRPKDAPLSDFGARLTLTSPSGSAADFKLTEQAEKLETDEADTFYTTVLLWAPKERELGGDMLSWFQKGFVPGADQQTGFSNDAELSRQLEGVVSFDDPRAEPITVTVDFGKEGPQRVAMAGSPFDLIPEAQVARVQYATATASSDVFGIYKVTRWDFKGGSPDLVMSYMNGYLYYFGRSCETTGVCTFQMYNVAASGAEPASQRALICGPKEEGGSYCAGLADSRPYEPSGGLLRPTVNENFFTLAGPILTGSDDYGSHGNPGEPAIINSWHKVRAEFKDGKVTGTLTTSHLQWDVVNGQQVNPRTISVTVEFEGVKQK